MTAVDAAVVSRDRTFPDAVDDVFDRPASIRAMAVLRIVLGPVVVVHLAPFLSDTAKGITFDEHFHEPWWGWVPQVPGEAQVAMVWIGAAAAMAMSVGWRTRLVGPLTTLCVAGNLFLSQTHFRHNRAYLVYLLAAVALSDSGRVLSLDARRARRRAGLDQKSRTGDDRATIWPMWTLRILVSSVYFASGFSKLIDPDWVSGRVLWDRAVRFQSMVGERLPDALAEPVVEVVTTRWVHAVSSPIAVAMELFIAFGLWVGRTRLLAVWIAIFFHVSIEITASVEVFSAAAIAALAIWAVPRTRDRIVVVGVDDPFRRWIHRLDWLARFEVRPRPDGALEVVDRDGTIRRDRDARQFVLSRLPLTFFFVAPLRRWR